MNMLSFNRLGLLFFGLFIAQLSEAQFLMDMIDTTTDMGKGMLSLYSKFDRLRIGGYIQPQFQIAQQKGARSYNGGDFLANANSRFLLRRSRIRVDYIRSNKEHQPTMQFVFQFDATERGVVVRDVWTRLFDQKWKRLAFTTGIFARPFGYELNLSSSDRESPERGRMSQILMKTERDLGAMVTFESRQKKDPLRYLKIDAGIFNGQGLTGTAEFDSFKDFIGRISLKPFPLGKHLTLTAGLSLLEGGLLQNNKYRYTLKDENGVKQFAVDSSLTNVGQKDPRRYRGADVQLRWKHPWGGSTELRGEYWWGTQTATATTSETPGSLLGAAEGYYVRSFNGAFFYLLQHIFSTHHQLGIKYDWYDPNTKVAGQEIGRPTTNLSAANLKYSTYSLGYNYYVNENLKLMVWYDLVRNEASAITGFDRDVKDNVMTFRLQYRF